MNSLIEFSLGTKYFTCISMLETTLGTISDFYLFRYILAPNLTSANSNCFPKFFPGTQFRDNCTSYSILGSHIKLSICSFYGPQKRQFYVFPLKTQQLIKHVKKAPYNHTPISKPKHSPFQTPQLVFSSSSVSVFGPFTTMMRSFQMLRVIGWVTLTIQFIDFPLKVWQSLLKRMIQMLTNRLHSATWLLVPMTYNKSKPWPPNVFFLSSSEQYVCWHKLE